MVFFNGSLLIPALQLDSIPTCFSDGILKISSSPQDLIVSPGPYHVPRIPSHGSIRWCPLFLVLSFSALPSQQPYASANDLPPCATVNYEEFKGHCCERDCWCLRWKRSWSSKSQVQSLLMPCVCDSDDGVVTVMRVWAGRRKMCSLTCSWAVGKEMRLPSSGYCLSLTRLESKLDEVLIAGSILKMSWEV